MSLYESFDFYEVITEAANIAFSLERVYGRTFLTEFFPGVFFFSGQGENTPVKIPRRNSVKGSSSKVRRNTSPQRRWKNYAKHRQSQTYT